METKDKKDKKRKASTNEGKKKKHKKERKEKKHSKDKKKKHKKGKSKSNNPALLKTKVTIQLSEEDYFTRSSEFRVWLWLEKKKCLDELLSEKSHEMFDKFVKKWNKGKLEGMYYEGIPDSVLQICKRSKHQWGFAKKMSPTDKLTLETAKDSVSLDTETSKNILVKEGELKQQPSKKRPSVRPREDVNT
mmetsp:Transcript_19248/g.24835  ORF Transcript_19248/g.24835 Transcript_19248/m.24835 type:complete len:190 (+) Transcript_19248:136-705(+)